MGHIVRIPSIQQPQEAETIQTAHTVSLLGIWCDLYAHAEVKKEEWILPDDKFDLNIVNPIQRVHAYLTCEALNDNVIPAEMIETCVEEMTFVCDLPREYFFPPS